MKRWLPIFFGCHCRPDRSFSWHGEPFPICARCTGELVGMLLALAGCWFWRPPFWLVLCLMVPLIVDGRVQQLTSYESTNFRRLITGILFGWALIWFLIITVSAAYHFGQKIGHAIF